MCVWGGVCEGGYVSECGCICVYSDQCMRDIGIGVLGL